MSTPATITIGEAAGMLGVSRNSAYEQAKTGELAGVPVIRVGRRLIIPRAPFLEVLGLDQNGKEPDPGPGSPPSQLHRKVSSDAD